MSESAPTRVHELERILPPGLSIAAARAFDLDRHLASHEGAMPSPPLALGDGELDLIWSLSTFSKLGQPWELWLTELERLLRDGGLFAASLPAERAKGGADPGREWVVLRKRAAGARASAGSQVPGDGLVALLREIDADHRRHIDAMRERFHREQMRKSYRIAELELPTAPTPTSWAIAERVVAQYEATLSWRVTRPLRAAKRMLARR